MENRYILGLGFAYSIWCRQDLEPKSANTERIAEVLREAGIEVYEVHRGWLACEPRPAGVWEALTGRLASPHWVGLFNCPPEQPGRILRILADKGIAVSGFDNPYLGQDS